MSGGSWEYVYHHLDEAADKLSRSAKPERKALGKKMELMSKAMHDIEWTDSGDYDDDGDQLAIRAALGKDAPALILTELIAEAKQAHANLAKAITTVAAIAKTKSES